MNLEHLRAILWLRYRLSVNQWRRGGVINLALMIMFVWTLFIGGLLSFFVAAGLGTFLLPKATSFHIAIVWNSLTGVFLVSSFISLMTEVQRSELLSLEKMLQLPVSLRGAFLLNYLTSFVSLSLIVFLPAALGLALASVFSFGPSQLWLFPLIFAFVLMITSLLYQIRGWLAIVMQSPKRKRTVVVVMTLSMVALAQLPNLVIQLSLRGSRSPQTEYRQETERLSADLASGKITNEDYKKANAKLNEELPIKIQENDKKFFETVERYLGLVDRYFPPAWAAYGATEIYRGNHLAAFLAVLGMGTVSGVSLYRGYNTTLKIYTGSWGSSQPRKKTQASNESVSSDLAQTQRSAVGLAANGQAEARKSKAMIQWKLPLVSDHVSAIAMANLVSFLRAPETKMLLIAPITVGAVIGVMLFNKGSMLIQSGFGAYFQLTVLTLFCFGLVIIALNTFGMDRASFRSYILMPIKRSNILAGKNLVLAIIFVPLCSLLILAIPIFLYCSIAETLGSLLQLIAMMFFVFPVGNIVSILAPMPYASGTGRPATVQFKAVAMQMLGMMVIPFLAAPIAIAFVLDRLVLSSGGIVFLLVSIAEIGVGWFIYRASLESQGKMLANRETKILTSLGDVSE